MKATIAAGSFKETVSSITPTASGSETSKATGAYSFVTHLGQFSVDTGALLGTVDVVVSGATLYIKVPAALVATTKGKPWVSAALDNPPSVPGTGNITSLAGGADPSRVLEAIQHAATAVTKVGSSTVNGAASTQYKVTIDLTKDSSPLAASEAKLIGGSKEIDDVYVAAGGQIVKVVQHVALSGNATGTITSDYTTFGTAVTATPPPASGVIDAKQVLGQ